MEWESLIGLEVHLQLNTNTKIDTGVSTAYGAKPNTQAFDVSIALPGALPVINKEAVRLAIKFGLSIGATINKRSVFVRKHYFYPDLPKGYQISQLEMPVVSAGKIEIDTKNGKKIIGITRAHLEEDAGKSLHEYYNGMTGIDFNRAGIPLLEIVSEPNMHSSIEAVNYLKKLHTLVRYLEISDGNMQEGSLRCDVNVSIRPKGQITFGTRVELKNINSFRFIEKAIEHEVARQIDILQVGGNIVQETRLYNVEQNVTRSMRAKEDLHDYRYFPDPDLPEMILDNSFIETIRHNIPELPEQKTQRFERELGLTSDDAKEIASDRHLANYFESVCKQTVADSHMVANWIINHVMGTLKKKNTAITSLPIQSDCLASLLNRISDNTISVKIAKEIFDILWTSNQSVDSLIEEKGLKQMTDYDEIEAIVSQVLSNRKDKIQEYKHGKKKILDFFVGQVMKKSRWTANPKYVKQILMNHLD